jgi:hypothetical protein
LLPVFMAGSPTMRDGYSPSVCRRVPSLVGAKPFEKGSFRVTLSSGDFLKR